MPRGRALAGPMAVAMRVRLTNIRLPITGAHAIAMHAGKDRGEEEKDGVNDAESKARLEHSARLVDLHIHAIERRAAEEAEAQVHARPAHDMRAVRVGDEAQGVHGADEGAHEEQVDEGHEGRVCRRAVVREEREDGPGGGEHGHDEEDEDVVGRQRVDAVIAVHEVG